MCTGQARGQAGDMAVVRATERATLLGRARDLGQAAWCRNTLFGVATWLIRTGVATHYLVSQHGWPSWCCVPLLLSQHGN